MDTQKFHLAFFTPFVLDEWNAPMASAGGKPWDGQIYLDIAKSLERACFDYIMFEDTLMVSEAYGGTERTLKGGIQVPKHDPIPLVTLIGSQTNNLGVVATMSTMAYPPFLLARLCSTVDHIVGGRFGWNIVTSAEDDAARNFGFDKLPEHDSRYDVADEYMALVNALFDSWDDDAVLLDAKTDTYADFQKVRPINFVGKHYKSRGPLNTAPSPQKRPTYVQAGGSDRGRDFAAQYADSIVAGGNDNKGKKEFRDDVRRRAAGFGRNPDDIKVLFLVSLLLGETEEEAKAKHARYVRQRQFVDRRLALISSLTDIDFSQFALDQPLPTNLTTNGEMTALRRYSKFAGSGKTLGQIVEEGAVDLVGTPEQVADGLKAIVDEVGGDGFLIRVPPFYNINRRYVLEITEGLVPALQRKGLVRTEYTGSTLRETLKEF